MTIFGLTTWEELDAFISRIVSASFSSSSADSSEPLRKGQKKASVKAAKSPSSEEQLTVTLFDGTAFDVRVSNAQSADGNVRFLSEELLAMARRDGTALREGGVQGSSDLADFLVNAVITGATQNANGVYEVETGKEYSIILTFAESSSCQFKNREQLIYQMPEGIEILTEQESDGNINIVYKGRTYQVGFHYVLDTNGLLTIRFDTNDPDFPRLEESTNVSFRFTYTGEFDGSKTTIEFNDVITKDITFDEPDPGQAYAEKEGFFDETTGKIFYTITVRATGDVTDVNVRDVISGNALIFNNDVQVSGNSGSYTDNHAENGFDYTFASMNDGEVITITYSCGLDYSLDSDKDGKLSVDQTKNTITVDPDPGDPHTSEYSREITYKYTVKHPGTEADTTEDGDKIINWEIEYNPLALVAVPGDTITDKISAASAEYMKYHGNGITVEVYDHSGSLVETRDVSYGSLTNHTDSTWTYTIPTTDTTPYRYVIKYQTIVDMDKVNSGTGVAIDLINTANDSSSSIHVHPDNEIDVVKEVESFTTQEVTWNVTLSIPQEGLTSAVVTDYLPAMTDYETTAAPASYQDLFKEDSLIITPELQDGEGYDVTYSNGSIVITFYKNVNTTPKTPGLNGVAGGRTINVRLTTLVDQEWLKAGYEVPRFQNHVNTIDFNGKTDTATVIFGKPGIEKTAVTPDGKSFLYSILISGLKEDSFSITDTFDTSLLEVDTSKASDGNHMRIFGGTQYSQIAGKTPVSYTDTTDGIVITGNSVPKQPDGNYYPYYRIDYYLKLKNGVDLEQLAIANGGKYDLTNTAVWNGHENSFTYNTKYDFLNKKLLNAGELGGTNRKAQYKITFNPAKATLNKGDPMVMTDVMSANLSVDYGSIQIVTDPPGQTVPYSLSGGKDEHGVPNGTTVATYTVPDSTKVVITYNADVRGNSSQTIVNTVSVNDEDETITTTKSYGTVSEGEGAIASFKIVKVDGYDANKKLSGVRFRIFAENPALSFDGEANQVKEIELTTDDNGEIVLDGGEYTFHFNECYHVQEIEPLPDYGTISFDYLVTLTNDMAKVDYGHYIYYYSDTMQIKNWPLEGLIVEKQVDSDVAADKEQYYKFRVYILDENGNVDTSYNAKNGDDQFENGVVEFQLKDREQKMFWGFEKGTRYKVEEIEANGLTTSISYKELDENGNVTPVTVSSSSHSGTLTQSTETVVFKNSKSSHGSLKVKKSVTVGGAEVTEATKNLADGTYTFIVKNEDGDTVATPTITITNGVSNTATVSNLLPGDYTVTEDVSQNPTGMTLTSGNDIPVVVAANNTANIPLAEFTNDQPVGSLQIKKNVTVGGAEVTEATKNLADGTYTFSITGPNSYSSTLKITITNGVAASATLDGETIMPDADGFVQIEPVGEYTVTEDTTGLAAEHIGLTSENPQKVQVSKDNVSGIKTAEFVNNKDVGGLKLKKTWSGVPDGADLSGLEIIITNPDGTETKIHYSDFVNDEYVVATNVPVGLEYSVRETNAGTLITAYTLTSDSTQTGTKKIVKGTDGTIELINKYTQDKGSLKVKKSVTVNGAPVTEATKNLADGGDEEPGGRDLYLHDHRAGQLLCYQDDRGRKRSERNGSDR